MFSEFVNPSNWLKSTFFQIFDAITCAKVTSNRIFNRISNILNGNVCEVYLQQKS